MCARGRVERDQDAPIGASRDNDGEDETLAQNVEIERLSELDATSALNFSSLSSEILRDIVACGTLTTLLDETQLDPIESLAAALHSDCDSGLVSTDFIEENRSRFGANRVKPAKLKTIAEFARDALDDATLQVLIVSGVASLALETALEGEDYGWLNGVAILCAVLIVVVVECVNNNEKQRSFVKLNAMSQEMTTASVTRFGHRRLVPKSDIVCGDVVELQAGDINPSDGVVIEAAAPFLVDQSHITGESDDVEKRRCDVVFGGSKVTSGRASSLSIAVGKNSSSGEIADMISVVGGGDLTPLQLKLQDLAITIGRYGITAAVICGAILATPLLVGAMDGLPVGFGLDLLNVVIIVITIVVVSVPEVSSSRLLSLLFERSVMIGPCLNTLTIKVLSADFPLTNATILFQIPFSFSFLSP